VSGDQRHRRLSTAVALAHTFAVRFDADVHGLERGPERWQAKLRLSVLSATWSSNSLGNKMTGEGFSALLDLVDRGVIRILDLKFVTRDSDGSMRALELADIDRDGHFDLAVFAGASSGLLSESDLGEAASVIEPGSAAGILIFENRWATPFVQALRRGEAELVSAGYIPQTELVAALDAVGG
jgi:Family of unknown function (DUF6325)